MNYLKELLRKSGNTALLTEFNIPKTGVLRINSDKKETLVTLTAPEKTEEYLICVSLDTANFANVVKDINEFVIESKYKNDSYEISRVNNKNINIVINRYGVDIVQIIVRLGNIAGFQLIDDNTTVYEKLKSLEKSLTKLL